MNDLVSEYKEILGLNQAVFTRIDHDDTIVAMVYQVIQLSAKPLILKIGTGDNDYYRELYFLNSLGNTLPIPQIVETVEPTQNRPGAILMECIEGHLLQDNDWTEALAYDIGSKLATLHFNRIPEYGDVTNPKTMTSNACKYFEEKFFEELEECSEHLPKEIFKRCQNYYEAHQQLLKSVDGPCLIHRDFRPGNLIVNEGKLNGIIDWSGGRSGFAEQDFCSMEHRSWPKKTQHKNALLKGYQSMRPVPSYNRIMPLLRLGRALAVIGFTVKSGTWKGKNQKLYHFNRQFLDQLLF